MSKSEFLKRLEEALKNDMNQEEVSRHLSYYREYIREEVEKGRLEQEVLEELGDPWLVAKNLVEVPTQEESGFREERSEAGVNVEREETTYSWKRGGILLILGILIGIILLLGLVIGAIHIFFPVLFPVLLVLWIIRKLFYRSGR